MCVLNHLLLKARELKKGTAAAAAAAAAALVSAILATSATT